MSSPKKPIIIGGFFRSGTSLARRILDSHSHIHCAPEIKFFRDIDQDYANDPLKHIRLFSTLPSLGLERNEIVNIFGRAFIAAHELAAQKAGKPRWADKNPENVLYLSDWQTLLPEGFQFIHVVRDPYDALASLQAIGFEKTVPRSFKEKVLLLQKFLNAAARYIEQHPDTSYILNYELLTAKPQETLSNLFSWLGENFEPEVLLKFSSKDRRDGIEDPKVKKSTRIHSGSIGRGANELSKTKQRIIQEILGAHLKAPSCSYSPRALLRRFFN